MALHIATVAIAGTWWRQLPSGLDPTRRPAPPKDSRWQRGEVIDAVYLADWPQTAWAEWFRWLAESALPCRAIYGGSRQKLKASSISALPRRWRRWDSRRRVLIEASGPLSRRSASASTPRAGWH